VGTRRIRVARRIIIFVSLSLFNSFNFEGILMRKAQASLEYSGMIALDNQNGSSEVEIKLIHYIFNLNPHHIFNCALCLVNLGENQVWRVCNG